jgi:hypothetical protein
LVDEGEKQGKQKDTTFDELFNHISEEGEQEPV